MTEDELKLAIAEKIRGFHSRKKSDTIRQDGWVIHFDRSDGIQSTNRAVASQTEIDAFIHDLLTIGMDGGSIYSRGYIIEVTVEMRPRSC